jgi:hypothetical protein
VRIQRHDVDKEEVAVLEGVLEAQTMVGRWKTFAERCNVGNVACNANFGNAVDTGRILALEFGNSFCKKLIRKDGLEGALKRAKRRVGEDVAVDAAGPSSSEYLFD